MAKKKFDPKAKAKRQKVIAGVGGGLLLVVLVIQVPRTMKMMSSQGQSADTSTPSSSTTASGTQPLAPPSLAGSGTGAATAPAVTPETSADGVSDPTSPLPPAAGQLISFSGFKSKDPFKQQISTACSSAMSSAAGTSCASSPPDRSRTAASGSPASSGSAVLVPTARGGAVSTKPTSATISVDGTVSTVTVGSSFPSGAPVFKLVSLSRSAAKIGIASGSYESGATTVTLKKGKTVTLMNTADGTRYTLRLVSSA
jgi:hypothetical protein